MFVCGLRVRVCVIRCEWVPGCLAGMSIGERMCVRWWTGERLNVCVGGRESACEFLSRWVSGCVYVY